jgi:hypothetical protein
MVLISVELVTWSLALLHMACSGFLSSFLSDPDLRQGVPMIVTNSPFLFECAFVDRSSPCSTNFPFARAYDDLFVLSRIL